MTGEDRGRQAYERRMTRTRRVKRPAQPSLAAGDVADLFRQAETALRNLSAQPPSVPVDFPELLQALHNAAEEFDDDR